MVIIRPATYLGKILISKAASIQGDTVVECCTMGSKSVASVLINQLRKLKTCWIISNDI